MPTLISLLLALPLASDLAGLRTVADEDETRSANANASDVAAVDAATRVVVQYPLTAEGDWMYVNRELVIEALGVPTEEDASVCHRAHMRGTLCWSYAVDHESKKRFLLSLDGEIVQSVDWDDGTGRRPWEEAARGEAERETIAWEKRQRELREAQRRNEAHFKATCSSMRKSVAGIPRRQALRVADLFTTGSLDPFQASVNLVSAMGSVASVYAENALSTMRAEAMASSIRGKVPGHLSGLGITQRNVVAQRNAVFFSLLQRTASGTTRVHEAVADAESLRAYLLRDRENLVSYTALIAAAVPGLSEPAFRAAVLEMYCP
jgi:hypothetical protein